MEAANPSIVSSMPCSFQFDTLAVTAVKLHVSRTDLFLKSLRNCDIELRM